MSKNERHNLIQALSFMALFIFFGIGCFYSDNVRANNEMCTGHFINPITDLCWGCLFPLSIGNATVVRGDNPDTENPSLPLQVCREGSAARVGLTVGYWEPFAITDVTRTPYCLVNLGGIKLDIPYGAVNGASESLASGTTGAFYQVHWYKYPLIFWLNLLTSAGCFQQGDYDIGYVSELDPLWDDDELSFILNPEDLLFANKIAQDSCALDAIAASSGSSLNQLFWCMGSQGSSYPLTGHIQAEYAPLENATLMTERMAYKLHKEWLLEDSVGKNVAVCHQTHHIIIPKNRYRYELVNPTADANSCYPFGHTTITWQAGKLTPADKGNYGFMVWRKRNCVFL